MAVHGGRSMRREGGVEAFLVTKRAEGGEELGLGLGDDELRVLQSAVAL